MESNSMYLTRSETYKVDSILNEPDYTDVIAECYGQSKAVRSVRFAATVNYDLIRTLDEYSKKEIKAFWYTPEEKFKRHARCQRMVARLESGKAPKKGQTYRGLEGLSEQGHREMRATIVKCIDAVMDEQDRQWRVFRDDYDQIAIASIATSGSSKQRAFEIARLDAESAVEDVDDLSSSETASDHAEIDIPIPVTRNQRRSKEKGHKSRSKKGRKKNQTGKSSCPDAKNIQMTAVIGEESR